MWVVRIYYRNRRQYLTDEYTWTFDKNTAKVFHDKGLAILIARINEGGLEKI